MTDLIPKKLLGAACFVVLCITLSLGLWPFHIPRNQVKWLGGGNGVEFGKYGTVWSAGPLNLTAPPDNAGRSIEIWLRPSRWESSATFLSFYTPDRKIPLALCQSLTDVRLDANLRGDESHAYVDEVLGPALRRKKPLFLTVTSGAGGTTVYADGAVARRLPKFRIPTAAFTGRMVVGDVPRQPDSFSGEIRGLALFNTELSAGEAARDFESWTSAGHPRSQPAALYLFGEHAGSRIHNQVAGGTDLEIPERYKVLDKIALEPFWDEINLSRGFWSGVGKNIIGFMPFGFIFFALTQRVPLTVVLGTLTSLTIEVGQIFLPMRDSGTTDLFTNTLGTYFGVLCCRHCWPVVEKMMRQVRQQ